MVSDDVAEGPRRVRRVRVLIADDLEDHRALLRARLDNDDRFQVVGEARDGAEAVRMAEELEPDAVVLDLSMPVMDGFEALDGIRQRAPRSKVVVLSEHPAEASAARAYDAGAFAYLEKSTALRTIATVLAPLSPIEYE